jgi:beta-xylosidase
MRQMKRRIVWVRYRMVNQQLNQLDGVHVEMVLLADLMHIHPNNKLPLMIHNHHTMTPYIGTANDSYSSGWVSHMIVAVT